MSSFMTRHFKWYGMVCKSFGLIIVHSRPTSDYDEDADSFSWNKLYFMYSLTCVLVCAFIDVFFIYQLLLTIPAFNFIFTSTVSALLHVTSAVKVALNASIPFMKSRSLQRFFNESSEYEQRVHFVGPPNHRKPTLTSYLIRPLLLVVLAVNVCICSYLSITQIDHFGFSPALSVTLKITVVTGHVLFYVYDATCFLVLRPCCEVIRSYIEHQHMALQSIIRRGGTHDVGADKRARLVEMVRLNLCAIFYLKRSLNNIWGQAVAVSGGIVLSTSCISFYLSYVEGFQTLENLMTVLYAVLTSLDFLDITILSGSMVSECGWPLVQSSMFSQLIFCAMAGFSYFFSWWNLPLAFCVRKVRHTLENVVTYSETSDYVNQVLYLRDALKPGEMALSAADFFKLKLPMLVSLAGAFITYTVILVQTSETVNKSQPNL